MRIKVYEFRKILLSPIFIFLTILFLAYNYMLIMSKSHVKEELSVLNEIVSNVGYEINDDMMIKFKNYYEDELKNNNEKATIIEGYYNLASALDESYEKINIKNIIDDFASNSPYNEKTTNMIKDDYEKFSERFNELKENGEHKNLFFYGIKYNMHTFLFIDIFKAIIFEIMTLTMLGTAFIVNYEFDSNTALIVYSSKRGRNTIKDKLIAALVYCIFISTIIIGITLLMYFSILDYSGLWKTSISNFFGQEYKMPFMCWWNMSMLEYLAAVSAVVYVVEVISCLITFILSIFIKNNLIVCGSFALIVGSLMELPKYIVDTSNLLIPSVYTPFTMIINPSYWFMMRWNMQSNKWYEVITLSIWFIGIVALMIFTIKKFKKESIK